MSAIAVLDAGKTHTRLVLLADGCSRTVSRLGTPVLVDQDRSCMDVARIEAWFLEALREAALCAPIAHIIPVTHGAAFAHVSEAGDLISPVPDYEAEIPDNISSTYESQRPPFSETGSPSLPAGLNLGRQLAGEEARLGGFTGRLLPYPQYWAARLSGILAAEVSSLGCHTDLWAPARNDWSSLAVRRGWAKRFAPLRHAGDALGRIRPEIASSTGLSGDTLVYCGVHDSNAALLAVKLACADGAPDIVISTGTWHVIAAPGTALETLDPALDASVNVSPDGEPVPSARFMGGREMAGLAGGAPVMAELACIQAIVSRQLIEIPAFDGADHAFDERSGNERQALAALHAALTWDMMIDRLHVRSGKPRIAVEGPATASSAPALLASLRPDAQVCTVSEACNPALGAASLIDPQAARNAGITSQALAPVPVTGLSAYRAIWRQRMGARA